MVDRALARKWTPLGLVQRFRRTIRTPSDVALALKIGYFIHRVPVYLARRDLPEFMNQLRTLPRPRAADVRASMERIVRLRSAWLWQPLFRKQNTCYTRALTLYRFLDAGNHDVSVHFGVEQSAGRAGRLRGHAWVTIDGDLLEGPEVVAAGHIREVPLTGEGR